MVESILNKKEKVQILFPYSDGSNIFIHNAFVDSINITSLGIILNQSTNLNTFDMYINIMISNNVPKSFTFTKSMSDFKFKLLEQSLI